MIRKILGLMTAICVLLGCAASAEGGPEAVTSAELEALLASVREQALASEVLNDPADEAARSEDGIRFQYTMADFYAEGDALTAETPVNVLLFQDSEGEQLRILSGLRNLIPDGSVQERRTVKPPGGIGTEGGKGAVTDAKPFVERFYRPKEVCSPVSLVRAEGQMQLRPFHVLYSSPRSTRASSDSILWSQTGSKTRLTLAAFTPSTLSTFVRTSSRMKSAAGQDGAVKVMSMSTVPSSFTSIL